MIRIRPPTSCSIKFSMKSKFHLAQSWLFWCFIGGMTFNSRIETNVGLHTQEFSVIVNFRSRKVFLRHSFRNITLNKIMKPTNKTIKFGSVNWELSDLQENKRLGFNLRGNYSNLHFAWFSNVYMVSFCTILAISNVFSLNALSWIRKRKNSIVLFNR